MHTCPKSHAGVRVLTRLQAYTHSPAGQAESQRLSRKDVLRPDTVANACPGLLMPLPTPQKAICEKYFPRFLSGHNPSQTSPFCSLEHRLLELARRLPSEPARRGTLTSADTARPGGC